MDSIDRLLSNSRYAHLANSHTRAEPRLKLVVLTCMDARIDLFKLLGMQPGDAQVLRNAGGRATEDVIRSLALSQASLGTEAVMVIHHTGCALHGLDEAQFKAGLEKAAGVPAPFAIGAFDDAEASVREDVEALRSSPFLSRRDAIRGFIYDIERGALVEVM